MLVCSLVSFGASYKWCASMVHGSACAQAALSCWYHSRIDSITFMIGRKQHQKAPHTPAFVALL